MTHTSDDYDESHKPIFPAIQSSVIVFHWISNFSKKKKKEKRRETICFNRFNPLDSRFISAFLLTPPPQEIIDIIDISSLSLSSTSWRHGINRHGHPHPNAKTINNEEKAIGKKKEKDRNLV